MQPLVPFVVLLSCSVSFIPPEKLLFAWTPTVDLGLSSGASAGEVSPQPLEILFPLYYNTTNWMMWMIKGWEEQTLFLGLTKAIGIAGSYTESAVQRIRFIWAGHGCGWLDLGVQNINTAAHWPPAGLLLSPQSCSSFIWWRQSFSNITLRKWFPDVLFFILNLKVQVDIWDFLICVTYGCEFCRHESVFSCRRVLLWQ